MTAGNSTGTYSSTAASVPANEKTAFGHSIVGWDPDVRTTTPQFKLGEPMTGSKNSLWIYVQAPASQTTGACAVSSTTFLASAGTGFTVDAAFAAGEYGWAKKNANFV